jgi:hypothetical protein
VTGRRASFAAALLAAAAAAGSGACSEVTTDPNTPVAIAFDSLPAPSIVIGDTLRNPATGAVIPLAAQAFNSSGNPIEGATFTFFPGDTGGALQVVDGNLLVANKPFAGTARIVASLNGLQLTRTIFIVPRPDRIEAATDSVPTLTLEAPDKSSNVTVTGPSVRVRHDTSSANVIGVRSWIVTFAVTDAAASVADSVRLVDDAGARSTVDTTDASGIASRRVRVYAKADAADLASDSVAVKVSATYKGSDLVGSPLTIFVPVTVVRVPSGGTVGRR